MSPLGIRPAVLALGTAALLTATAAMAPTTAAAPAERGGTVTLAWYDITAETVAKAKAPTQVTNSRTWAVSWLAAARATRRAPAGVDRGAFQDAALATAVHHSLVALAPARAEQLDAAWHATLDGIPDGPAEDRGVAAGAREAHAVLASRAGDGLDPASVSAPFTTPPPGPGVWQPTPPAYAPAAGYGSRLARPFLMDSADEFRPGPPPALDSDRYREDLAEVRAYGALDSTRRTAHQTQTAAFWYGVPLDVYTGTLRVALARSRQPVPERARLVALFHVASVDTQIAISDSKFAYVWWRPVTAIRTGAIDPDPAWTPLHAAPPQPEYPSGHGAYAGAAEAVLAALTGPRTGPFELTSATAPGVTRTYTAWRQLTEENVDARVFSGIHTRTADEVGATLGRRVAGAALRDAWRLFGDL
ncbi:vanadium-dependent haloperoxidase [Streptomyces sp. B1866]|uniref:vanadium-dependent haloperoxidase n=1 Tax=Streptomyces sp. B1866 TaxID=3075431 RepID=UPI002890FFD5|nr:vanadium-dependent haloperoxidase [Streptomyces sp. B1866]MDT3395732.1 vanadium-dependent haloperoxidase [Streptomyces sp. B1866]